MDIYEEMHKMLKVVFLAKDVVPRVGLMILCSIIKKQGHMCSVLVDQLESDSIKKISKIKPDIVAFSICTGEYDWALRNARKIKKKIKTKILVGGSHPTFFPEIIKQDAFDIVCRGEAEEATKELIQRLSDNKDISRIKNLWVKKNGKIFKNAIRNLNSNLDTIPFPDRTVYKKYAKKLKFFEHRMPFVTSRGCPHKCTFCFNDSFRNLCRGKFIRRRSPHKIIKELCRLKKIYDVKQFEFVDDSFTLDHIWLRELLKEYKEKVRIPFICNARANELNEEIIKLLKQSGCSCIRFGIESGSDRLRNDVLMKNITNEQIIKAAKMIKKYKVKLHTFNILGIPSETIDEAFETVRLNRMINPEVPGASLLHFYPGLPITEYAIKNGFIRKSDIKAASASYFSRSILRSKDKNKIMNLQKLFYLAVRFPSMTPLIKILIRLPPNILYDYIFKITFGLSMLSISKSSLKEMIKILFYLRKYVD